jgi:RNA polymerase sigma-70 factor (ECF subfamily)
MNVVAQGYDGVSDAGLAIAIARYDQQALAEVYRRHAGVAFGLARRLLVDRSLAEDVIQEVFLRLWNDPTRYDPGRGSMRSFLLSQTHSRSVDALRADAARRNREQRDVRRTAEAGMDVERQVEDLTTAEHVRRSLDALPPGERAAIELAYWGGYTYREVAARLDEPEGTVKSRIRLGLQRLRRHLDEAGIVSEATS